MIITVDKTTLDQAAAVHSAAWKESHRAFCTPDFVALHSPERQRAYLGQKLAEGSRLYMLVKEKPVGVVSVTGSLIEDLYVLPDEQNKGFGTELLRHAMAQCGGTPVLWILENNAGAERLYRRMGFAPTGRRNRITDGLDEIEFTLAAAESGGARRT
ncbi:MAG: GNAT family N-acetyltransferase [Clostridia bacterium]|nr:GNAT family N-acetyltransferase [Clostridia bacterium]